MTSYKTASPCGWKLGQLNERMPWTGFWMRPSSTSSIAALRAYRSCPDLASAAVLGEAADLLNGFVPRLLQQHRHFNVTNASKWRARVREISHWLCVGESHLQKLLLDGNLVRHFDPGTWSSAPFFRATGFIKAVHRALPVLGGEMKLRRLPKHQLMWWKALELELASDVPMQLDLPSPASPCTLPGAVSEILQVDELRFQASPTWDDAVGLQIRQLLASAQFNLACMTDGRPSRLLHHFMFRGAHLFFSLLDRLDCRLWSAVNTPLGPNPFWTRLLPAPFSEANSVRGFRNFHCDDAFRELLEEIPTRTMGSPFRFVEVGASLGGCTFHVLTSVPAALALAVEPYQQSAEAIRHTASWNGLADRLIVHQGFVSDREGACRLAPKERIRQTRNPEWNFAQTDAAVGHATNCVTATLDKILTVSWGNFETLDLLRVHVDGREEQVLKSLGDRLHPAFVHAIALAMWTFREEDALYNSAAIALLLQSRGYELRLSFLTLDLETRLLWNEDATSALQNGVNAGHTMTLIARKKAIRQLERCCRLKAWTPPQCQCGFTRLHLPESLSGCLQPS